MRLKKGLETERGPIPASKHLKSHIPHTECATDLD